MNRSIVPIDKESKVGGEGESKSEPSGGSMKIFNGFQKVLANCNMRVWFVNMLN